MMSQGRFPASLCQLLTVCISRVCLSDSERAGDHCWGPQPPYPQQIILCLVLGSLSGFLANSGFDLGF